MARKTHEQAPHIKRRCVELYSANTPFRPKVVASKKLYQRRSRNQISGYSECRG